MRIFCNSPGTPCNTAALPAVLTQNSQAPSDDPPSLNHTCYFIPVGLRASHHTPTFFSSGAPREKKSRTRQYWFVSRGPPFTGQDTTTHTSPRSLRQQIQTSVGQTKIAPKQKTLRCETRLVGMASSAGGALLLTLFNATGGEHWLQNGNWGTDTELRLWYGVEANDQGRVVELKLMGNILRGIYVPVRLFG